MLKKLFIWVDPFSANPYAERKRGYLYLPYPKNYYPKKK